MRVTPIAVVLVTVAVLFGFTVGVSGAPSADRTPAYAGGAPVTIPEDAREVAPGVYALGERRDGGQVVEGYLFVRYEKGFHHRPDHAGGPPGGGSGGDGGSADCYSYIFDRHTRWRTAEPWVFNPANDDALDAGVLMDGMTRSIGAWEAAASTDVFGAGSTTTDSLSADTDQPDDRNEVYFGSIESPGAIAVTVVWAVTRGPPSGRTITEWDQVYDQADYAWSTDGAPDAMDFENIAAHENGHAAGMGHTDCAEQTMYGTADYGETKKRSLEDGDRAGAASLYT